MTERIFRGRRVLLPNGTRSASIHVKNGQIVRVAEYTDIPEGAPVEDVGDLVLMPGIVDTHVHINEPGRTEWEGFETATRAAAAGGVTTLMDMPLNSIPPTTTRAGFDAKAEAASGKLFVDVMLAGGVVPSEIKAICDRSPSAARRRSNVFWRNRASTNFVMCSKTISRSTLPILSELNAPLLVHAELPGPLDAAAGNLENLSPSETRQYARYLASRPKRAAEDGGRDGDSPRGETRRARARRSSLVGVGDCDDRGGAGSRRENHRRDVPALSCRLPPKKFLMAPRRSSARRPFVKTANQDNLWKGLKNEGIVQVVTDHSPSTPNLKCVGSGDFSRAWGGIASLQLGLAVVWTEARARGATVEDIAKWMCAGTSRLVGLEKIKGTIAVGADADFCVWDPDAEFTVHGSALQHRHKLTPYDGRRTFGSVVSTILRGETIYDRGDFKTPVRGKHLCKTS